MSFATLSRCLFTAALALPFVGLATPAPVVAEEVSYWPEDEDDKELKNLDNEVLRLQKARFQAIFAEKRDEKEIERINREFKKAQKARGELLIKTGRY